MAPHIENRKHTPESREERRSEQKVSGVPSPQRELPPQNRLEQIRHLLGKPFMALLSRINQTQRHRDEELRLGIETDYLSWVLFFEEMKKHFKEAWDLMAVLEADSHGWFRFTPNQGQWGPVGLTSEGYNFGIGIELNQKPNVAFPRKWLIVTLAHSSGWNNGIGDERSMGRESPIDDNLVGLKGCKGKDLRTQIEAARELKERTRKFPLIFQMYSEDVGQKAVKVPVEVLEERPLAQLCQGLFIALNKDLLNEDITALLPGAERIELDWKR